MSIEDAKKELFKRVEEKMDHEIAAYMKERNYKNNNEEILQRINMK